jgi:predicted enzyme related to lactoylglutathione lyase
MVTRDTAWPPGTPCWVDLGVEDIGKAKAFYSGLFGWEIQEGAPESGGYCMAELDGRPVAGIGPKMGPAEIPPTWTTYIASADAGETARKIREAGGQVMMEPMDVMDVGRMARSSASGRPVRTAASSWPTSQARSPGTRT